MAQQRRQSTAARYGWVLTIPPNDPRRRRLSPDASTGLFYLRELAENAAERRHLGPSGRAPERRTVATLAREDRCSRSEVYRLMKKARVELFGKELSDSAIYHRLRRDHETAPQRTALALTRGAAARSPLARPRGAATATSTLPRTRALRGTANVAVPTRHPRYERSRSG